MSQLASSPLFSESLMMQDQGLVLGSASFLYLGELLHLGESNRAHRVDSELDSKLGRDSENGDNASKHVPDYLPESDLAFPVLAVGTSWPCQSATHLPPKIYR